MLLCVIVCIIYITRLVNYIFFSFHVNFSIRLIFTNKFDVANVRVQFEDLVLISVIDYSESENMNCVFLEKVRYIFFNSEFSQRNIFFINILSVVDNDNNFAIPMP